MHATTPNSQPPEAYKVIVIGAGFAGLAAATTLCNNTRHFFPLASEDVNHNQQPHFSSEEVVILEASDRIGGRACTLPLSDALSVELGCTWIHGIGTREQSNPILAVASAAGLMSSTPKPQTWWESTFLLPERKEELKKEEKILVHKAIAAYAAAVDGIENTEREKDEVRIDTKLKTVGAAVDAAWLQFVEDEQLDTTSNSNCTAFELVKAAWRWREQLQRAIDGCNSTHDMDAAARSLYTEFGESEIHASIPCGYQKIAETLALGAKDENFSGLFQKEKFSGKATTPAHKSSLNIKFDHQVEFIEWGKRSNENDSDNMTNVSVTCSNGAHFEASAVIITTSLGVLKQHHASMFRPALPGRKVEAIENLKIGVVDKIFIDFNVEQDIDGNAAEEKEEERSDGKVSYNTNETSGNDSDSGEFFENFESADKDVITYALLWDDEEDLGSQGLPQWAKGIFSIRWGGPEFKRKKKKSKKKEEEEEESERNKDVFSSTVHPRYSQAVMWLTGDAARSMEASSDTQVLETIKAVFKKFPGIALPLLKNKNHNNKNKNNSVDGEEDVLWKNARLIRSQWGLNPFTAGSYSYVGPTGSIDDVTALAAPITTTRKSLHRGSSDNDNARDKFAVEEEMPVLLFAGEACHVQYIGTTHAAFLTGTAAAEILLKLL